MNQQELKQILSSKFDFEVWKPILESMFLKIDYLSKPIQIDADLVKNGGQVGVIRLDDGRSLGLFIFEVADNIQIARNRKGLRDIAIKYVDQDIIHGALVFYYSENQADYRLTFVSKQTSLNDDGSFETKATAPKRYTFLLGANEPCTTAANRLLELINKKKNGSVYLDDVKEAFSVERLNKDFFKGYKEQYFKFLDLIGKESKDNRDYVKKLLGRLVFLQFLQKKGWMGVPADRNDWEGGDKNYLYNLIQKYKGNDRLLSDVLEVLFFNTLNENRSDDIADPILGDNIKIPYLNGGLFDKDDLDKKDIDFPYAYFKELMEFFGMYNFTIDENDPDDAEVGVDPEMLGHIFENLLEDNKDKGAFYTPKEIVQYMSQESIAQYLKTHTDETLHPAIDALIKRRVVSELLQNKASATAVYNLLQKVKVCDPAIGSGAFPMGVLNVLYHARLLLYGFTKPTQEFSPANVKREIIQNNIYGVDIEKGAVDIARLRFWLALVVDETQPHTLPNLDYKIMCGNSLIHRFALDTPFHNVLKHYNRENKANLTLDDYRQWVYEYTDISDHTQKDIFRQKIEEIKNAFKTELTDKEKGKLSKVRGAIENLQAKDIFGEQIGSAVEIKKLQKQLKELEQQREDIESNKIYENAFEWRFEFPALLDNEGNFTGFDVVIGNPPYVNINTMPQFHSIFKEIYPEIHTGYNDLMYYFICQGIRLLSNYGILSYITSNYYLGNDYANKLRLFLNDKLDTVINFHNATVFDSASVHTAISFARKKNNSEKIKFYTFCKDKLDSLELNNDYDYCELERNLLSDTWIISNVKNHKIIEKLKNNSVILGEITNIAKGAESGKNGIFSVKKDVIEKKSIESEIVRQCIKNSHIHKYMIVKADLWLIYCDNDFSKEEYPNAYAYLENFKKQLLERRGPKSGEYEWWRLHRPSEKSVHDAKEKLVVPYRAEHNRFAYDDSQCFNDGGDIRALVVKKGSEFSIKFLLGLLNSTLLDWYYGFIGKPKGNAREYFNKPLSEIPIFKATQKQQQPVIDLVDKILAAKKEKPQADTSAWEEEIDRLVYELYGLTEEEIEVVEGK